MKESAVEIVKRLRQAGHAAYFVGGCVRDLVMGHSPQDYDIATSALPDQVMKLFPLTVAVGEQFGIIVVVIDDRSYEVATFRSDGDYRDGRHPEEVVYTNDPRLDVLRRDFTINGLLYDPLDETVIDFVEGRKDIQAGTIRTIGPPDRRFQEDKLRLVRAVRFAARFNFKLESETRQAVQRLASQISQVSRERLREELIKILTEGYASSGIKLLEECLLLRQILPEVSDLQGVAQPPEFHPEGDVWVHTLLMLELMDQRKRALGKASSDDQSEEYPSATLALGVLLHDIGKPSTFELKDRIRFNNHCAVGARMAARICDRFRLTNKQTERIVRLVEGHLKFKDLPQMRPSTLKRFLRQDGFEEHLELHRLDCLGSHGNLELWSYAQDKLRELKPEEIRPHLFLRGDDLVALGYEPGPIFKEILKAAEDAQLDGLIQNREEACEWVLAKFGRSKNCD